MDTRDGHEDHCDNTAVSGVNPTLGAPISPDGAPVEGHPYTVPARQGRAVRVPAGQVIRIVNPRGTQVCDTWAFNARDRSEYLSWPHTRVGLSRVVPRVGDVLTTNRRRPILTLVEDTSPGVHDTLMAACDIFRYRSLGAEGYHDNCSDNLRMAMMAIGLPVAHVPQPLNLWMNIPVHADWSVDWLAPVSRPGDHVLLRAEMDCIVAMSACPQDMIPINGAEMTPQDLAFVVEKA